MKKNIWTLGMGLAMMLSSCGQPDTQTYLKKVIEKMENIQSVEFQCRHIAWDPYSEDPVYDKIYVHHEYSNPADTAFGSSYVWFVPDEGMRFEGGYDGNVKMTVYAEHKGVMIDDFSTNEHPFRLVGTFFNNVKNILNYALETTDSIETTLIDEDSCYHFSITIHEDSQVEFFGKAVHLPNEYLKKMAMDPTSHYEVWIRKSDDIPYKYYRKMAHNISSEECINPIYNKLSLADFNLYDYIPKDYEVRHKRPQDPKKQANKVYALQDKPAPEWTLTDIHDNPVSLAAIKSKVVLLNFTGIGCGPCQLAIPFLKELKAKYSPEDLELIAIESWSGKTASRKGYAEKKELNYQFLGATEEVLKEYKTGRAAPWFFLLDENHIVRKVFYGYSEERTSKEIKEAIETMLKTQSLH